nr:hypothetical protein [Tanacetum cinerariifolium]
MSGEQDSMQNEPILILLLIIQNFKCLDDNAQDREDMNFSVTEILQDDQAPGEINCAYQGDEPDSRNDLLEELWLDGSTDELIADMPPRKRACLTPALGFEIGESSAAGAARQPGPTESDLRRCRVEQAGYGITKTWDEIVDKMMEIALTTLEGVNERVTELDTT